MRIVSLLPSATELLCALGAGDDLVAVTHECDHPPEVARLPAVTRNLLPPDLTAAEIDAAVAASMGDAHTIYALQADALAHARPDVIVTQQLCEVCAVPHSAVVEAVCTLPSQARVVTADPLTLSDMQRVVREVATAIGRGLTGERVANELQERLASVERLTRDRQRPSVIVMEWPDPPWTGGHWVPEMVETAGGTCLVGSPGAPSERSTWTALGDHRPEIVIAAFCGLDLDATKAEVEAIAAAPKWRTLTEGARVVAVDGSAYVSRPGPRLVDGTELFGWIFHRLEPLRPPPGRAAERDPSVGWIDLAHR
ncbi:MAG: ABC transporter substrate-binding protein [Egibacteraceae bacterium]